MTGKKAWAKRLSAILLVTGLVIEFFEAASSDREVAELRLEAAKARLETEQIKKTVAWREITDDQKAIFKELAKQLPKGIVVVQCPLGDPESAWFAYAIAEMLSDAGYPTRPEIGNIISGGPAMLGVAFGIKGSLFPPPHAAKLHAALSKVGVESGRRIDPGAGEDCVLIVVGTKIPPHLKK